MSRQPAKAALNKKIRLLVYGYLPENERHSIIPMLSKEEKNLIKRKTHIKKEQSTIHFNLWNKKDKEYATNNKHGMCLAHEKKLEELFRKLNFSNKDHLLINFSANTWNRCTEHGPADELAQFLLELPDDFHDCKVSLIIDETGEGDSRFDLNMLMFQLSTYKPELVFKDVTLMGNQEVLNTRCAEAIDILFSKAVNVTLSNLTLKAVAWHKVPLEPRI